MHALRAPIGSVALLLCLLSIALAACQSDDGSAAAAPAAGGSPAAAGNGEPSSSPPQPGLAVAGRMGDPIVPAAPRQVEAAERPESPQGIVAFVTRVVNGDTIEVLFENGGTETVRLVGVDAPERPGGNQSHRYEGVVDTACLDDWGNRALDLAVDNPRGPLRRPRAGQVAPLPRLLRAPSGLPPRRWSGLQRPVGRGGLRPGLRGRGEPEEGGLPSSSRTAHRAGGSRACGAVAADMWSWGTELRMFAGRYYCDRGEQPDLLHARTW